MMVKGAQAPKIQSEEAFGRLHKGEGRSFKERRLEKVQRGLCGVMIGQQQALRMRQSRKVCELKRKEWATSEENPTNALGRFGA